MKNGNVNAKIRQIRVELKLTQKEMSTKVGVTQSYYSCIESSKKGVSNRIYNQLFEKLNVNPNWLFKNEGSMFNEAEQAPVKQQSNTTSGYNQRLKDTLSSLAILEHAAASLRFTLIECGLDPETIDRALEIYENPALIGKDILITVSIDGLEGYYIYKTNPDIE